MYKIVFLTILAASIVYLIVVSVMEGRKNTGRENSGVENNETAKK